MWIVVVKVIFLILLTWITQSKGAGCPPMWFDCGNGKCIAEIWHCDGDNDCGNLNDEKDCDNPQSLNDCFSSQFKCDAGGCVPERWHCDGEPDCVDGSDEQRCDNVTEECTGFTCRNHHCIPDKWRCDGNEDCADGSDEELCPQGKLCTDAEFLCSSGSCVNKNLVCNGKNDCIDGSDEGVHCGDPCENFNCSQNCKKTPTGPVCYCNDGYVVNAKDNKTCDDIDECQEEGFCSHECINTIGSYKCSCRDGYQQVNRTCKAKGADPLLIFTTVKEVRGMRLRSNQYFLVRRSVTGASAVDVDPKNRQVYWVEISNKSTVYSAKIDDGSGSRTILSHGLLVPEDIAVDYIANNLYITDSGLRQVLACKTDGTMCHVLHDTNVEKPRSIVLDPDEGLMYWSDWGNQTSGIYRSGMDGSRRIALVSNRIGWPNGIALDHTSNRLYWADAKLNTIEFITLDGSLRKVILNSTVFHPYSLTVFEDSIYWSDWSSFSLESCNKFTGHKMTIVARENGRHIMGIHIYHPVLMAKVSNPCWSNDCSHMCLISPVKGFSCACPHGFKLSTDGKTCSMEDNGASVFVSEGSSIFHIRPQSVGSETVTELPLSLGATLITRVSYDSRSRYLFVADVRKPAIYAINMTSLHIQELVRNHLASPEDLAFDWKSSNLYWIDSMKKTVEVISVNLLRRVTLLANLMNPVSLAISPDSGYMFVATFSLQNRVTMYGMDGRNKRVLNSIQGRPLSLALHPSKSILYWADPQAGTISYVNYSSSRSAQTVKTRIDGVMSLAASEEYIYWTARRRELNLLKDNVTHVLQLPGQEKGSITRKVTYSPGVTSGVLRCLIGNGGCSYVCLTSPTGRTCACSSEMTLSADNVTCIAKNCDDSDFKCVNGRCVSAELRCDGIKDCEDGSDEVGCSNRCTPDDFQCKNGRCILKSWRCDYRDDCGDNSDEQDCPPAIACTKDQASCLNGECISILWRCDGEADCSDFSDEINCNTTSCNTDGQMRCSNGQCLPLSWFCDGTEDCADGSDEKNCSKKAKPCISHEFRCESDGACIDENMKCDGRPDCGDASDEMNCPPERKEECKKGMFVCKDGACLYDHEVCDGHNDCQLHEDESNCTHTVCQPDEILCPSSKRCIIKQWICDGDADCTDESDEENCDKPSTRPPTLPPVSEDCDEFYCYVTGKCLPWSKVCDGRQDCEDLPDEGGLCSKSCSGGNGGCSQICKRTPHGSKCFCNKGYKLLPDNKTCDDIDECREPGACSHFCNNTRGSFKCSCAKGYRLHGHSSCKAEGGSAPLLYLLGDQIRSYDLHSHSQKVYVNVSDTDMKGMDYDGVEGVLYWTQLNDGSVNSLSVRTQERRVLFKTPTRPIVIKYDWIAKNLYYRDEITSIVVCRKDGKFCRTLIQSTRPRLDSMDISPPSGLIFWTIWANPHRQLYSGLVERAQMDGAHRTTIVSQGTKSPTAITVDNVLNLIYWSDTQLNILECADFHGFNRRQVVRSNMHHPFAIALFEDYVYWADWGTDSMKRCHKFDKRNCENLHEGNVKARTLLLVHKVMQPKGPKADLCTGSCQQICLLTRSNYTCVCDDRFEANGTCKSLSTAAAPTSSSTSVARTSPLPATNSKQALECPVDYCHEGAECTVTDSNYVCKCSPPYSGERCENKADSSQPYDYSWIIAVLFALVMTSVIVLLIVLCVRNREKLHRVGESVTVKFRNPKSSGHDGRLVMDMDDASACEELVLGQEGEYKQCFNSEYASEQAEEGNFKKWPPYGRDSQRVGDNIANFFQKLKGSSAVL